MKEVTGEEEEKHFLPSLSAVAALLRLEKQYGTFLVLLPALWTLFIASEGRPDPLLVFIIIFGAFLMRSAGCAINDIADREFDPHVDRTKERPLASGRMRFPQAVAVFVVTVLFAALLTLYFNKLAIMLSVCCLFFVILYPFTKRYVSFPQVFLGIAFGWGSVIVWAAVRNEVAVPAFLVFLATATWAVAYDTIYAMMDIEDDLKVGVKSTAILFGRHVKEVVAVFFAATILLLIGVGISAGLGLVYYISLIIASAFFVWQVLLTVGGMDRETAFRSFKSNVLAGFIILAGVIGNYFL
ncbi:MAG: 4-hydroxybenzoate octaprenyltransferase [Proteobacteria bacterium]|nr:4-hydroxybenzoate octaprenyltransferase [Pseudomonadota bacterium]